MIIFEDIKYEPLYKVLMEIRKTPEVWLRGKSLKSLEVYIDGFLLGKSDAKKPTYYPEWYGEFRKYVFDICVEGDDRYGIIGSIYRNGYDDENGLNRYFQLLDDFCREKCLDKELECPLSKFEKLEEREIRAVEIGRDAIFELAIEYISNNFNQIFNLQDGKGGVSKRIREILKDVNAENIKIIVYDTNYCKTNVEELIKNIDISTKTLMCDKPYTVIKIPLKNR